METQRRIACPFPAETPWGGDPLGSRPHGLQCTAPAKVLAGGGNYLTVTPAPTSLRAAAAFSAVSLLTFSRRVLGAPSTTSLASLRPSEVSSRTTLMTWIFFSPADSMMTSNSSCSTTSPAPAPGPASQQ